MSAFSEGEPNKQKKGIEFMQYQLRKKDVLESNRYVIRVSYCGLQFLLNYRERAGYIYSKTYGWQADVYHVRECPHVAIVTGYQPIGSQVSYDLITEYDNKAHSILTMPYSEKKEKGIDEREVLESLIKEFVDKAIKDIKGE